MSVCVHVCVCVFVCVYVCVRFLGYEPMSKLFSLHGCAWLHLCVYVRLSVNLIEFLFCLFVYWVVCETKILLSLRSSYRLDLYHSTIVSWYKSRGSSWAKTIIHNTSLILYWYNIQKHKLVISNRQNKPNRLEGPIK